MSDQIPTLQTIIDAGTNAEVFNEVVTGSATETTKTDSIGKTHRTLKGLENEFDNQYSTNQATFDNQYSTNQATFDNQYSTNQATFNTQLAAQQSDFETNQQAALTSAGYSVVGNFTDGATLTGLGDAIYYAGDLLDNYANEGFYAWTGVFPKVVTAGDTPFDESGWQLAATGYTKQSGVVQLFGQVIDTNFVIPIGQNALSINPTISDGVTVTVPSGSTHVILGSTN